MAIMTPSKKMNIVKISTPTLKSTGKDNTIVVDGTLSAIYTDALRAILKTKPDKVTQNDDEDLTPTAILSDIVVDNRKIMNKNSEAIPVDKYLYTTTVRELTLESLEHMSKFIDKYNPEEVILVIERSIPNSIHNFEDIRETITSAGKVFYTRTDFVNYMSDVL